MKFNPHYFLVFILVGLMMTYFGVFGLSGIGMILGGNHFLNYDMNDLSWCPRRSSSGVSINPAGQLFLNPDTSATEIYVSDLRGSATESFPATVETKLSIAWQNGVALRFIVNLEGRLCVLIIHESSLQVYSDTSGNVQMVPLVHMQNTFYTYRLVMDDSKYDVYRDANLVTSGVTLQGQVMPYYVYLGLSGVKSQAHVDYFYGSGGSLQPTYVVNISAFCNTESSSVNVLIAVDGGQSQTAPLPLTFAEDTIHTIVVVDTTDLEGHPFLGWDAKSDKNVILAVSSAGDHVAHYQYVAPPPPETYQVNAYAHDDTTNQDENVFIAVQENPSLGKTSPCLWNFNVGTSWTLVASATDSSGNPFLGWESATDGQRSLHVSGSATVIAHYRSQQQASVHIPVTVQYYNGTDWDGLKNFALQHYRWASNTWVLLESASTNQYGVYDCWSSQLGIHNFTATYQGESYSAVTPSCSPGEYWPLLLQVGEGPRPIPDIWQWLRDLLSGVIVGAQPVLLYGGIGLTAISSLLWLFVPSKKRFR